MKVLVYPHDLGPGGSQLNAVEVGAGLVERGHEVVVYGQAGPLTSHIRDLGLSFIESPSPSHRPSPAVVKHLASTVADLDIDVLHGYEWPPAIECYLAARLSGRHALATVMSMSVAPFIPRHFPLVVGTEQIAHAERRDGRAFVRVLEPPVDLSHNDIGTTRGIEDFRARWTLPEVLTIVVVSRLVPELKLEGILTLIDAMQLASRSTPLRLVVVGDGPARTEVLQCAARANAASGFELVVLTGHLDDPRPAYAAADIAVGMGGSALRALAFGAPLVVQGEQGFFRLLTPDTVDGFLWTGFYGVGGSLAPVEDLAGLLVRLVKDDDLRHQLGAFGRSLVGRRFDLTRAAERQEHILMEVLNRSSQPLATSVRDDAVATSRFAARVLRRRWDRGRGRVATDDSNSTPVVAQSETQERLGTTDRVDPGAWVWHPGVPWDAVAGTDRRLVTSLARIVTIIWVDPPLSPRHLPALRRTPATPAGVVVVRPVGPPGPDRPAMRWISDALAHRALERAIRRLGSLVDAVVVTSPYRAMPVERQGAVGIYYETDDFVAGAGLLRAEATCLARQRKTNLERADLVLAITQDLLDRLPGPPHRAVLPNGVQAQHFAGVRPRQRTLDEVMSPVRAGLFGQLNDRIDLSVLESLAEAGVQVLVVGPVAARSGDSASRIASALETPGIEWIGHRAYDALPDLMATVDVGITPYTDTAFNRSSYPLKTLEYLAAGLPVVSTYLPSMESLEGPDVVLVRRLEDFVSAVVRASDSNDPESLRRRRELASANSWDARAQVLVSLRDEIADRVEGHGIA